MSDRIMKKTTSYNRRI
uniref:Uncharacterized protein n=1 Tax=Anguilla anguilla TaxID=7936 RepID=A0A0E9QQD0_ANGAN